MKLIIPFVPRRIMIFNAFLFVAVLILGIMGTCSGCTHISGNLNDNTTVYKSEALGVALTFPAEWLDKYIVDESEDSIYVFCKDAGLLFTLVRVTGELVTQEDINQQPVKQQIVLQGNGYTYLTRLPSDIQYPLNKKEIWDNYISMSEQIADIPHWINLLGNQRPKAENEGFKVEGTSFFVVEIPDKWEIKAQEDSAISWNIFNEDNSVGVIDMIPYNGEYPTQIKLVEDDVWVEYLSDNEIFREFRIKLNSKHADKGTIEKIKSSFVFGNGPFNVIDLQSNAERYIAAGGQKVFGMIEDIDVENGKPVAIRVNVMSLLANGSDDESRSVFYIEDLKRIETYSLDFGVHVAPLVPANYTAYGIYEMPLLDENFLKNYGNFRDFYYDFIIGSDGQLKVIVARYIPLEVLE